MAITKFLMLLHSPPPGLLLILLGTKITGEANAMLERERERERMMKTRDKVGLRRKRNKKDHDEEEEEEEEDEENVKIMRKEMTKT